VEYIYTGGSRLVNKEKLGDKFSAALLITTIYTNASIRSGSGRQVDSNVDLSSYGRDAFHFIDTLMLGKDT